MRSARRSTDRPRPAFVVGAAVDRDRAWDDVVRLAERHNARACGWRQCRGAAASPRTTRSSPDSFRRCARRSSASLRDTMSFSRSALPRSPTTSKAHGPHCRPAPGSCQLIDDPSIAAWTPQRHVRRRKHPRSAVLDLLARGRRQRASACCRAGRAAARRQPRRRCRSPSSCRRSPRSATLRHIVVEEAPSSRPAMQSYLPIAAQRKPSIRCAAAGSATACRPPSASHWRARVAGHRPRRRRLGDVLDPGAVERRAAEAADDIRHPQQPALRGAAGVRAHFRLRTPARSWKAPTCAASTSSPSRRGWASPTRRASSVPMRSATRWRRRCNRPRRPCSRSSSPDPTSPGDQQA